MKSYSLDVRLKVLAAVDLGIPRKEVARTFGVSMPTLERYLSLRKQTGEIGPAQPSVETARRERRRHPGAPLRVVGEQARGQGFRPHFVESSAQAGLDEKKRSLGASERVKEKRGAWRECMKLLELSPGGLLGVGPRLCGLPRTPYTRSSQNLPTRQFVNKARRRAGFVAARSPPSARAATLQPVSR